MRGAVALAIVLAAPSLTGCGGEEALRPLPGEDAGVPEDAGTDAAPPKRIVLSRNPFGNVAERDNLLWDGDFEWSSPVSDQYGWLTGTPYSFASPSIRIGAECRSGIKCAAIPEGKVIVGIGVAAEGQNLLASFWAKLPGPACDGVDAMLFGLFDDPDPDTPIGAESAAPDEQGYCLYSAVAPERIGKTYLYIKNMTDADVVIDDALLKAVPKSTAVSIPMRPPTADQVAALAAAVQGIKDLLGPHDPPPNAARRAVERWARSP